MQEKSLARNGIYKALLNGFNLVIPLLVGPYITGLLNEELYGIYNRVYTEYSVFLALASFGIYNYGVREISRVRNDPVATNKLFTSLFLIGIVSNGAAMLVYVPGDTLKIVVVTALAPVLRRTLAKEVPNP